MDCLSPLLQWIAAILRWGHANKLQLSKWLEIYKINTKCICIKRQNSYNFHFECVIQFINDHKMSTKISIVHQDVSFNLIPFTIKSSKIQTGEPVRKTDADVDKPSGENTSWHVMEVETFRAPYSLCESTLNSAKGFWDVDRLVPIMYIQTNGLMHRGDPMCPLAGA